MELYIKTIGDPNYNSREVHCSNEIKQLMTQIETVLFTRKCDVMGEPQFGANLEDLIYEFQFNEYDLKREINEQITTYCPLAEKYNTNVEVSFYRGEVRDQAQIDIEIDAQYLVGITVQ
tara:strand:- start:1101 stop:1457 length:357 start_codon:yes stop_codon:yes gene_type:complete